MKTMILKVDEALFRLEGLLIFFVLSVLIVMLSLQVLFRFMLNQPLDFTEEAARLLFVWLVFIGAARAMRVSQHFMVDVVYNALPKAARRAVGISVDALSIVFVCLLAWVGMTAAVHGAGQILPVMQISASTQSMALPVGMALMTVHALAFPLRGLHLSDTQNDVFEE